jgi:hypothetical protein
MMTDMGTDDEFAEFETTEDQIDAMMAAGEPVEVDVPSGVQSLYVRVGASNLSWGGSSVIPQLTGMPPSVKIAGAVSVPAGSAA